MSISSAPAETYSIDHVQELTHTVQNLKCQMAKLEGKVSVLKSVIMTLLHQNGVQVPFSAALTSVALQETPEIPKNAPSTASISSSTPSSMPKSSVLVCQSEARVSEKENIAKPTLQVQQVPKQTLAKPSLPPPLAKGPLISYNKVLKLYCKENHWELPIYKTFGVKDGYVTQATLRGHTFEGGKGATKKSARALTAEMAYKTLTKAGIF